MVDLRDTLFREERASHAAAISCPVVEGGIEMVFTATIPCHIALTFSGRSPTLLM
jgi:hypothetical protein